MLRVGVEPTFSGEPVKPPGVYCALLRSVTAYRIGGQFGALFLREQFDTNEYLSPDDIRLGKPRWPLKNDRSSPTPICCDYKPFPHTKRVSLFHFFNRQQ
jgi:hypothetical protein